jgi:hypothetical protein
MAKSMNAPNANQTQLLLSQSIAVFLLLSKASLTHRFRDRRGKGF